MRDKSENNEHERYIAEYRTSKRILKTKITREKESKIKNILNKGGDKGALWNEHKIMN